MESKFQKLDKIFRTEVHEHSEEIDPGYELSWRSVIIGWALGKGLDAEAARIFADHIRYNTDMG